MYSFAPYQPSHYEISNIDHNERTGFLPARLLERHWRGFPPPQQGEEGNAGVKEAFMKNLLVRSWDGGRKRVVVSVLQ
jgi:hypothetical protein